MAIKAKELNATPNTIEELVKKVDVIFLSIPLSAIPKLPNDLFKDIPNNVVIVDTCNYYPFRDGEIEELQNGKVESKWVSEQIGKSVVKAFNNLLAYSLEYLGKTEKEKDRIAMAVAGDDENAKKIVVDLINDTGFDAVDAGKLDQSWKHQPGTPAYCTELNVTELRQALSDAIKENALMLRYLAITKLMEWTSTPSHEDIIKLNRSLFPKNPKG